MPLPSSDAPQDATVEPPATAEDRDESPTTGPDAPSLGEGRPRETAPLPQTDREPIEPALREVRARIESAKALAKKLLDRVLALKRTNTLSTTASNDYQTEVGAWSTLLSSLDARTQALQEVERNGTDAALLDARRQAPLVVRDLRSAEAALTSIGERLHELESQNGWQLVGTLLRARCAVAICFDNGESENWLGIEPLVELPVGSSFGLSDSALNDYVNNHDLSIDLAAGIRVWFFRDVISLSVYLSKPLSDAPIRLKGSPFVYPSTSLRRPYPGIAIGALFDSIWIGFDRNELRNGDGKDGAALNLAYPPNEVISSTWTMTVALQPVTAFRTAIGVAATSKDDAK